MVEAQDQAYSGTSETWPGGSPSCDADSGARPAALVSPEQDRHHLSYGLAPLHLGSCSLLPALCSNNTHSLQPLALSGLRAFVHAMTSARDPSRCHLCGHHDSAEGSPLRNLSHTFLP